MTTVACVGEKSERERESGKPRNVSVWSGLSIALGPVVGVAIGIATHNIAVWLAIGIAVGIAFATLREPR